MSLNLFRKLAGNALDPYINDANTLNARPPAPVTPRNLVVGPTADNMAARAELDQLRSQLDQSRGRESWGGVKQDISNWAGKPLFEGAPSWLSRGNVTGAAAGAAGLYALYKMLSKKDD